MPLDPRAQVVLERMAATEPAPVETLTPQQARAASLARAMPDTKPEPAGGIADRTIPGPGGALRVRIYTPGGREPFPTLVYLHGGGWVVGSIESNDAVCRALASAAECVVMSVEYRLAPEHKFPAAAEDAYAATKWAADNAAALKGDASRLAVGGISAGGNLSAVVTLMARDRGGPSLALQVLVYPVTDYSFETPSYRELADGYWLTRSRMAWYWSHYLPDEAAGRHPYASPLQASDLHGLPAALVVTCEFDPLRDEGEAYAERLREAGVPVVCSRYAGMPHGFFTWFELDQARQAIDEVARELRRAFDR